MNLPLALDRQPAARMWARLLNHREVQFWTLQFIGWSGWATASAIGWLYWADEPLILSLYLFAAGLAIALTTALRYIYRALWTRALALRIGTAIFLSYVAGGVWQAGKNAVLTYYMDDWAAMSPLDYFHGILTSAYVMLLWSGLYFGIKYYQMLQRETANVLRITAMAHQAQLKMLRYQLNPHFLFNTLNAISTLILERDADNANLMVTRLSRFLRYSLDTDPMQRVTLTTERAALNLYLDIEQVRFGDRLRLVTQIEQLAERALIPSLLLQPIVENAIKYAIAPNERGGTISLEARVRGTQLHLTLIDDGPGIGGVPSGAATHPPAGRAVGLLNTRQRLAEVYPGAHVVELTDVTPHGLAVRIQIPFEVE